MLRSKGKSNGCRKSWKRTFTSGLSNPLKTVIIEAVITENGINIDSIFSAVERSGLLNTLLARNSDDRKSARESMTLDIIVNLCRKVGKEPGLCKDSPGFIVNRLLQPWRNEGYRLYDESVAAFEDIDKALKAAYGFRMGPFELGDLIGLEVAIAGNETMYRELRRDIFKPAWCHTMKIKAGDLGRKTGRGFYEYK